MPSLYNLIRRGNRWILTREGREEVLRASQIKGTAIVISAGLIRHGGGGMLRIYATNGNLREEIEFQPFKNGGRAKR
jgi:hypothetical protein